MHAGDTSESEVFKCRVAAAKKLVESACDELAANPPQPPFAQARLNIGKYAARVPELNTSSPSMTLYQPLIPIAVEARADFVSQGIMSQGAGLSLL